MKKTLPIALALFVAVNALAQMRVEPVQPERGPGQPNAAANAPAHEAAVPMGPGDLIEIVVYGVPELTLKTRVTNLGTVSLPLVGELHFGGQTPLSAEQMLKRELVDRELVKHPQVSIFISEYATQGITILGEVAAPGIYPLIGPHHLFDAISAAGGLTTKAGQLVTIVHKNAPNDPVSVHLTRDLSNPALNVELIPGDTITVAKTGVIYVVGEVLRPGGFLMENNTNMTLLQAIALAQGTGKLADLKKATVVRRTDKGLQQIAVRLDKVMKASTNDLMLQPDDIIFVPTSGRKKTLQRGTEAIIQAATGVAIYGTARM